MSDSPSSAYLEFSEGQEHKFYEVTVDGPQLTIRYGRIGTAGQTRKKGFANATAAQAEAEKKLAEKRKKGYTEATPGQTRKKSVGERAARLPRPLEAHRARIEATIKPAVLLRLGGCPAQAWESKVGGLPYRPRGQDWPTTPGGQTLAFLAQVNFAEMPSLPEFPGSGILQFFISTDSLYGFNYDDPTNQNTFRVIYHEKVTEDEAGLDTTLPDLANVDGLPLEKKVNWRLDGERVDWPMTASDYHFEQETGVDFWGDEEHSEDSILDLLDRYGRYAHGGHPGPGWHQLGGYPTFTQEDPRGEENDEILLFQLDSQDGYGIMWGDVGVAHFFIRPADLKKRDFSRVWYNWDCG